MANVDAASCSSSISYPSSPIDLLSFFNSSAELHQSNAASISSPIPQQISLSSVSYNVLVTVNNANDESGISFVEVNRGTMSRWSLGGAAWDFRVVPLSESSCLLVIRLNSGRWAVAMPRSERSSPDMLLLEAWTIVPSSIQHPVVRFVVSDGHSIKVEEKIGSV